MTEAELQRLVVDLCHVTGWAYYHTYDSRRSQAGFPDLVLIRPPELLFVELKSARGRATPEQTFMLGLLAKVPGVETHIWRPKDWPLIEHRLTLRKMPEPRLWPFCKAGAHHRCQAGPGMCTCAHHASVPV